LSAASGGTETKYCAHGDALAAKPWATVTDPVAA
jgi:hypothetical protein